MVAVALGMTLLPGMPRGDDLASGYSTTERRLPAGRTPKFLLDQYAEAARANSVAANVCKSLPLGDGYDMVIVPSIVASGDASGHGQLEARISQLSAVGITATANQAVLGVRSYSVLTPLSLQLLERGGTILDQVLMSDAEAGIAEAIDEDLISGTGLPEAFVPGVGTVAGEILGLTNWSGVLQVTYTDSTPTVTKQLAAINQGLITVDQARRRPAQHLLMSPDQYHWLAGATDTVGAPLTPLGLGNDDNEGVLHSADVLGYIAGVPVFGVPACGYGFGASGDEGIVVATRLNSDALLLQSDPIFNFVNQGYGANNLTVLFAARVYVVFALRISSSTAIVGGSGFKAVA